MADRPQPDAAGKHTAPPCETFCSSSGPAPAPPLGPTSAPLYFSPPSSAAMPGTLSSSRCEQTSLSIATMAPPPPSAAVARAASAVEGSAAGADVSPTSLVGDSWSHCESVASTAEKSLDGSQDSEERLSDDMTTGASPTLAELYAAAESSSVNVPELVSVVQQRLSEVQHEMDSLRGILEWLSQLEPGVGGPGR
eukprot:RCo015328